MYKILRCIDQLFWAYSFISQEHIKYSSHDMSYVKHDAVHYNADLLYIHSPDISPAHATIIPKLANSKGIKVVGAYAGNPVFWSVSEKRVYEYSDLIVTISPQTYEFAKQNYPEGHPIVFLPESVDTNFFKPSYNFNKSFTVGWAGGAHKKIKRTYLLDKLDFPVIIKSDWKDQRRDNVTTLDNMLPFYRSIDVLVITSLSECMPRVALEAMACGIPVISTDVGGMRMLIDKEFIVPVNPEEECVSAINDKLQLLFKYPELRNAVGKRNRDWIEKYWSWEKNTKLWDEVFTLVIENKADKAVEMADKYLENFTECFELLRRRFRDVHTNKAEPVIEKSVPEIKEVVDEPIINLKNDNGLSPKQQVLFDIYDTGIPCWLLNKACLECVQYTGEKLLTNHISIGVDNVNDRIDLVDDLEGLEYVKISNELLTKNDINVEIIIDKDRKTKTMALLNLQVLVPMPVIRYLKDTFGNDWENLK